MIKAPLPNVKAGIRTTCLIVPGLNNSGPGHWQSLWEDRRRDCRRVEMECWSAPHRDIWVARLDQAVRSCGGPIVFAAHSLGCLAVAWWAAQADRSLLQQVAGALLVAPPDVDRDEAHPLVRRFAPAPAHPLPFPSILAASRNDPYARFDRLDRLARLWDSRFVDAGACGHINADSAVGAWPEGEALLEELIADSAGGADLQITKNPCVPSRASCPTSPYSQSR